MRRFFRFQAAFWLILSAAGCGFKGDLYLPDDKAPATFGVIQTGVSIAPPHRNTDTEEQ